MKFMTKEIETVIAVVVFFTVLRLINFEAHFDFVIGDILFDIGSVIVSGIFGMVYSKVEIFEWQDHSSNKKA